MIGGKGRTTNKRFCLVLRLVVREAFGMVLIGATAVLGPPSIAIASMKNQP